MNINKTVNAKGLSCPIPLVKLENAIERLNSGDVVELLGTDSGLLRDMDKWCKKKGHILISHDIDNDTYRFYIQKQ